MDWKEYKEGGGIVKVVNTRDLRIYTRTFPWKDYLEECPKHKDWNFFMRAGGRGEDVD